MSGRAIPIGAHVGCAGGRGVVVGHPRRAVADVRRAATERERDMAPYAVRMDRARTILVFRGHELDMITPREG